MTVVDLAKQLLACASITPQDAGCQQIIIDYLSALGFECEVMQFAKVTNLWARRGHAKPLFVFAGHTDVVPPGPLTEWTSPPFEPTIRNGILYARGAVDMKGAIAAMLTATKTFLSNYPALNGSIGFLITSDEEGPSVNGTRRVIDALQQRGEKIDYCLIGEPSTDSQIGDQIRVGRRGSLHGKLTVFGKQGHVAHPHLAINPIHKCLHALHEIAHEEWDTGNAEFPATTLQITNIHAGTGAQNVIPGHVEILFNFRYGTAVTVETLKQQTEAILKDHHLQYKIEWTIGAETFLTKQGKLLKATQSAINKITNLHTNISTGGGTSDGRFIAPTGAEVVELGLSSATAHHVNECVSIADLEVLDSIYTQLLIELFVESDTAN